MLVARSMRLGVVVAGVFAWSLCGTIASATVVVPLARDQLVARSDLVVRATVLDHTTGWNETHTQIVTLTRIAVASYLKGAGPTELVVRQFGGTVGNLTEAVPGDGRLARGQDVVLFLRRGEGVVYLTALAQSVYYVSASATVTRDLSQLTFASTDANGRTVLSPPPYELVESLEELVASVRAAAGGAR